LRLLYYPEWSTFAPPIKKIYGKMNLKVYYLWSIIAILSKIGEVTLNNKI